MAVPRSANETVYTAVEVDGYSTVINSQTITVLQVGPSGNILQCQGASAPTAAGAGYARGCQFILTGVTTTPVVYLNAGSATSCNFLAVSIP